MNYAEIVREDRVRREMSYDEYGKFIGVSAMTIHNIERGGNVTIKTLLKILNKIGKKLEVV